MPAGMNKMNGDQTELLEDFQRLLQLIKAREEIYSRVLDLVKAKILSHEDEYEQVHGLAPFLEETHLSLRALEAQENALISKYLAKQGNSPKEMRVVARMRQRFGQLFEIVYEKSCGVLGGVRRLDEGHREFSRAMKEWGAGGSRPSIHLLLLLIVNYSRDKIKYQLSKLSQYKARLENFEYLRFSEVYFEEKEAKPGKGAVSADKEREALLRKKADPSKGKKQAALQNRRNKACFFVTNVLLRNYSGMNLSRTMLVEGLTAREDGEQQMKERLYDQLLERNREIGRCISQYYERSKSELNLKVERYLASYRPCDRSKSKSSSEREISHIRISSRQLVRRPRLESAHQVPSKLTPREEAASSISELEPQSLTRPAAKCRSSAKKVFVDFLNKRRSSNLREPRRAEDERSESENSVETFVMFDINDFGKPSGLKNRSKLLRKMNREGKKLRGEDMTKEMLKERMKCQLKNVVIDWNDTKKRIGAREEALPRPALGKSVLRQRRNQNRYGLKHPST